MKMIEPSTIRPEHLSLLADQHRDLYHSSGDFNDLNLSLKARQVKGNLFSQNLGEKAFCQSWPNPNDRNLPRHQQKEKIWSHRNPLVSQQTRITSLGSCFAIEIAKWLQNNNFNYLKFDSAPIDDTGTAKSSVGWGTLFNTPSVLQTIHWAFDRSDRPEYLYQFGDRYADPFLEEILFDSTCERSYNQKVTQILDDSRRCFTQADICIITLGLNEVFEFLPTGHYFHRTPWVTNPAYFHPKDLTVNQNVENLSKAIRTLRDHNPSIKIIFSVSPVPLLRSFHADRHVAESTSISKAILRLAVNTVCATIPNCYYFASYETVMYPGKSIAFGSDFRHVTPQTVNRIMNSFVQAFCSKEIRLKNLPRQTVIINELDKFGAENPALSKHLAILEDAFNLSEGDSQNSNFGYMVFRSISFSTGLKLNRQISAAIKGSRQEFHTDISDQLSRDGILHIAATSEQKESLNQIYTFVQNSEVSSRDDGNVVKFTDASKYLSESLSCRGSGVFDVVKTDLPIDLIERHLSQCGIYDLVLDYLGEINYVIPASWRSYAVQQQTDSASSLAAQQFHSDCDSIGGFLKVFIALTNIDSSTGPFRFIKGSHAERPKNLWRDGRLSDEEVFNAFDIEKEFIGHCEFGDIYIADTLGIHKGSALRSGFRDVIQIEFGNTTIGKPRDYRTPPAFENWLS